MFKPLTYQHATAGPNGRGREGQQLDADGARLFNERFTGNSVARGTSNSNGRFENPLLVVRCSLQLVLSKFGVFSTDESKLFPFLENLVTVPTSDVTLIRSSI